MEYRRNIKSPCLLTTVFRRNLGLQNIGTFPFWPKITIPKYWDFLILVRNYVSKILGLLQNFHFQKILEPTFQKFIIKNIKTAESFNTYVPLLKYFPRSLIFLAIIHVSYKMARTVVHMKDKMFIWISFPSSSIFLSIPCGRSLYSSNRGYCQ